MGSLLAAMLIPVILVLAVVVVMIISWWKIFTKAGQPGWAAIVPVYNVIVMTKVANKPVWWAILILLVPIANIIFVLLLFIEIAKAFGQGAGFGVGMFFLGIIFVPILGFGSAKYIGNPATA